MLEEGKNCTVEIPPERFNTEDWYDPDSNKLALPGPCKPMKKRIDSNYIDLNPLAQPNSLVKDQ